MVERRRSSSRESETKLKDEPDALMEELFDAIDYKVQAAPPLSELFIHQLIETIEFVLGCISNTASYLRLWALSLAHSQLARVFYEMTIGTAMGNALKLVMVFPVFGCATLGVLMFMDLMECFLHTLRLHWVEFQNKFYKGQGSPFSPFSFKQEFKQAL